MLGTSDCPCELLYSCGPEIEKMDSKWAKQLCASNTNSILEQSAQQRAWAQAALWSYTACEQNTNIEKHDNQTPLGNVVQRTPPVPRGRPRENSGVIVALFWGNTVLAGNKERSFMGRWGLLPGNQRECF